MKLKRYLKICNSFIKTYTPYFVFGILLLCILNSITLFRIQSNLAEAKKEVEGIDGKINKMTSERTRFDRVTHPVTYRLQDVINRIDDAEKEIKEYIYYYQ